MILFYNYFTARTPERQAEIDFCLKKNLECEGLKVIILNSSETHDNPLFAGAMSVIRQKEQPTYREIFDMGTVFSQGGICAYANADIFFTAENVQLIEARMKPGVCLALSRWDYSEDGNHVLHDHRDSQDTWVWKGGVNARVKADFTGNKPGCDNRIAFELNRVFRVINPSKTIKTFHVHATQQRTYTPADTVPPPYHFIAPHE